MIFIVLSRKSLPAWLLFAAALNLVTGSCTTNPATGQPQLSLIS
jgi:hypothetical protein